MIWVKAAAAWGSGDDDPGLSAAGRAQAQAAALRLALDPPRAEGYRQNAAAYVGRLAELDARLRAGWGREKPKVAFRAPWA